MGRTARSSLREKNYILIYKNKNKKNNMKIENSWVNLTLVKIEAGNDRVIALKEYNTGKVFRTDNDVDELDQIVLTGDGDYYICFEINKEIDIPERQPEYEVKYISLNDYYIYHFHSILDNEYLSWQEKPEMVRDLSNDIFELFNKCKYLGTSSSR